MQSKIFSSISLCLFVFLCSCSQSTPIQIANEKLILKATETPTKYPVSMPESTPAPRWVKYEKALSKAIMGSEGYICEWEIYGVSDNKVYVWALCESPAPWGSKASMPLVIVLSDNGQIASVDMNCKSPVSSPALIKTCFPPPIQPTMLSEPFMKSTAPQQSIAARRTSHGPPLLVIQGTPLP